jgi:hypothetical protein
MRRHPAPPDWKALLHPFLFGLAPIVFLYSKNVGEIPAGEVLGILIPILIAIFCLQWLARLAGRDGQVFSAGLSSALFIFFAYGHVYPVALVLVYFSVETAHVEVRLPVIEMLSHILFLTVLILAGIFFLDRVRRSISIRHAATDFLVALSALMVLFPLIEILPALASRSAVVPVQPTDSGRPPVSAANAPDIYYFLLDGYTREDILANVFNFDNAPFLDGLERRGFYIAAGAKSNYSQTALSIASTWNMEYLDALLPGYDPDQEKVDLLEPYLRENRVLAQLHASGYRVYAFASGSPRTEWTGADEFLQPAKRTSGRMESLLIETTGVRFLESAFSFFGWPFPYPGYGLHRERIDYVFETLPGLIRRPGPKIIIAHILAPHPPFVADAAGQSIAARHAYGLTDGSDFPGTREEYISGYRAEVAWINGEMTKTVDAILENSAQPPIIIMQGDHGSGAHLDWVHPQPEGMYERMRILMGLYLPGIGNPEPYAGISPVNVFRLVLDRYLGATYGFLPDRSLFSSTDYPFRILLVDESVP